MITPFYPIKDQFRESFCAMDIQKINLILEVDRKFCGVSKQEFVAAVSRIFNYLKVLGEDSFEVYGAKCISASCCNCNKDVLVFTSSKFKYFIAFMLEDDKERIFQIAECFNYDFKSPHLKTRLLLNDYIDANWVQYEYDIAEECIKELYPTDDYLPSINEFTYWLKKIDRNPGNCRRNKSISNIRVFCSEIIALNEAKYDVKCGLMSHDKLDLQDEASVLLWLLQYADTVQSFGLFFLNNDLQLLDNYKYDITGEGRFFFDLSEYAKFDEFETKFYKLFNPLCGKFNAIEYCNHFHMFSLSGPLQKLGIMEYADDYFADKLINYKINSNKLKEFNEKCSQKN